MYEIQKIMMPQAFPTNIRSCPKDQDCIEVSLDRLILTPESEFAYSSIIDVYYSHNQFPLEDNNIVRFVKFKNEWEYLEINNSYEGDSLFLGAVCGSSESVIEGIKKVLDELNSDVD